MKTMEEAGFFTKADDYVVPNSSEKMIDYLRLDYPGGELKFTKDKGFVCIEFKNQLPDVEHTFIADHPNKNSPLYTDTGCTGSATTIIPEYYSGSKVTFSDGDVLKVFDKNGNVAEEYKFTVKNKIGEWERQ
jgi:hypothetical protein